MSITTYQLPPRIAFSQNPNIVKLYSEDYRSSVGTPAFHNILFGGAVTSGTAITLKWAAGSVTMTAVANPDQSGKQFPLGNGSATYVQSLVAYFNSNRYIRRDYIVTYFDYNGTPSLSLVSRENGSKYDIAAFSGTISMVVDRGDDEVIKPNFTHLLEVHLVNGGQIYTRPLNLDYPYTGVTSKDISDILHAYLDYDIPQLDKVWQACPKSVKDYYLLWAQYYGETPEYGRLYQSDTLTVSLGGYSNMALTRIVDRDHIEKYLLPATELYPLQKWFEIYPAFSDEEPLRVRTNQPQFLYFLNCREVAESLKLKVEVTFADGTNQVIFYAGGIVQPKAKICVACGYSQLGLSIYNNALNPISSYTVQIVENATSQSRSVKKRFDVDRDHEEYTRYILYSGSDGNFKTLHCYGRSQVTGEITDSLAEKFESVNTPKVGNFVRHDVKITEKDELSTGYLVGDQSLDALQELLLARYAFRVIGDTLIPIVITSTKVVKEADGQNLNALKIDYRVAFDEKLYTGSTGSLIVPRLNTPQQSLNDL